MSKIIKNFKRLLVAVDLTKDSDLVVHTAHRIGQAFESEIHLVHAMESNFMAYNDNILVDLSQLESEIENDAKDHLKKLANRYHLGDANQYVLAGKPTTVINELAEKIKADLIVIGTHGKSGISLLLGSTANGVLHSSKCDVLAVRILPT